MRKLKALAAALAVVGLEFMLWTSTSSYVDSSGAWRPETWGDRFARFIVLTILFAGIIAFIMWRWASHAVERGPRREPRIVHDRLPPSKRESRSECMRLLTELRELPSDELVALSGGLGLLQLVLCAVLALNAAGEAVFSSPWWWGFTAIVWVLVVAFAIRAAALRDQDN